MKYNTDDENLQLWKCHPETVCFNCIYFHVLNGVIDITVCCGHARNHWDLYGYESKIDAIACLLYARNCKDFKLEPKIDEEAK